MTALPTKTQLIGKSVTKGSFKSALGQLIDYLTGLTGTTGTLSSARNALRVVQPFMPYASDSPDFTVRVEAGIIVQGYVVSSIAAQSVAGFTVAVTNPRIDRIVVDPLTGTATRIGGTEAVSPVAPAIPLGQMPLCQVGPFTVATQNITESMITHERSYQIGRNFTDVDRATRRSRLFAAQNLV